MKPYYNYFVTEDGNVYNNRGKCLKQSLNHKGYPHVSLRVNKKPHTKTVHRIVAETYIDNPNGLSDVDHIDGNKCNNAVANLRWVSHGENIKHSYNLNNRSAKGENNARCLTTEQEVKDICILLEQGLSPPQIRDLGFSYLLVRTIKQRQNWRHVSQNYRF